ncbi:MAG: tRNA (adenosine(37)-N6)-threonylcarbamoyltransferase complex transferase subunit TsaD, partial [candidate division Zixibacteria bacterium]|nr:tRNA (adenosine(37)-N6)-threonylcarbamoyltransferase complex transferase subunit TsaD [candidate division Zixibacteria bacterium]
DRLAADGDPEFFRFPRPMLKEPGYQFSYSGLKTAVALYLKKLSPDQIQQQLADIAASFQEAAVMVLVEKTVRAAKELQLADVTVSGGVAANSRLRTILAERLDAIGCRLFYPTLPLCTDNGAMIAAAGYYRFQNEGASEMAVSAVPYLKLGV